MTIPTCMRIWPPRPHIPFGRAYQRMSVKNRNWLGNHPMPAEHRRGLNPACAPVGATSVTRPRRQSHTYPSVHIHTLTEPFQTTTFQEKKMWSTRTVSARVAVSAGSAVGLMLIAGCGGGGHDMSQMSNNDGGSMSSSSAASQPNDSNSADVMFVQMMYPHHAQAVEMAKMVDSRTANPRILELAASIQSAQGPEMDQMTALLEQWGQPSPDTTSGGNSTDGMNHGGADSGMMSQQQMTELEGLRDNDFDAAWLNMMIEHHTGAIAMAQTELSDGNSADAKKLATSIVATQQAEIAAMQALLQQN